ncbi:phage tail tape measure protein [Brenneria izbisi]|uniref:Phage tail tape measure protein n=1 Tax=Brenneria izbisi TaxID=2939450 RepID=A0AA41Y3R1_9GAMM|nr:phage tail tape measure protein [Brenneria izbisi]MCV9878851.1 phage tail tape measure protein [Brenneria izbisi]MCV9882484.1 phage tail tape measure protein [Brenneria izbisi]
MATESSISATRGGVISGALRSAFTGVQGTLASIDETARRLQQRQNSLTQAMERYGQIGSYGNRRLNSELQRVGRTMEQLERQRNRLSAAAHVSDALQTRRSALIDQKEQTYASAQTVAAPVIGAVVKYASYEAGLRDIATMGNLDSAQEQKIGALIRQTALKVNQTQEALLGGVGLLINEGIKPEKALQLTGLLGKTATATQTDMIDLSKMAAVFSETLQITGTKELEQAFNVAASGAKLGSFKLKDMSQALPGLAEAFAAQGITGQEAVTQIVASLSVAKKSGGSADSAVNNMTHWLSVMNSSEISQKYENAGVDYETSMQKYTAGGFSKYEASLMIADRLIKDKGEAFLKPFEAAGAQGDTATQRKLMNSFGLSEVFTDTQSVDHLLSMRQDWGKYQSNKQAMNSPAAQNTLDTDFASQNDTLAARWRRTQIALNDVSIGIGQSQRPALISLSDAIIPIIDQAGRWIADNQEIVSGIVLTVAGFKAFSVVAVTTRLVLVNLLSPLVDLWKGAMFLRSKWLLLRTAFGAGGRARQWLGLFSRLGRGALWLGRMLGRGLMGGVQLAWNGFIWLGRGALFLGGMMGRALGSVMGGIKLLGRGAMILFRIFSFTPIGRLISGIVTAAPLLYGAFSWVMDFFGIDISEKFSGIGKSIVSFISNGIRDEGEKQGADSWFNWFSDEPEKTNSPRPVLTGVGRKIAQGVDIGIDHTTPQVGQELAQLQLLIESEFNMPQMGLESGFSSLRANPKAKTLPELPELPTSAENNAGGRRAGGQTAKASGGIAVTFSPNIYLEGKKSSATPEIASALNLSLHELEKMLARIMTQQQRRGYA